MLSAWLSFFLHWWWWWRLSKASYQSEHLPLNSLEEERHFPTKSFPHLLRIYMPHILWFCDTVYSILAALNPLSHLFGSSVPAAAAPALCGDLCRPVPLFSAAPPVPQHGQCPVPPTPACTLPMDGSPGAVLAEAGGFGLGGLCYVFSCHWQAMFKFKAMCYKSLRLTWRPWMVEKKAHRDHYLLATRLKLRTTGNAANHILPGQSCSAAELTRPTVTHIEYLCLKSQEEITAVTFTATFMYVSTELAEGCSEKQTSPIYSLGFWRSLRDLAHMNTKLPAQWKAKKSAKV